MADGERIVYGGLPDEAWDRVEATFFTEALEEAAPESPIMAEDGSRWSYMYFETPSGPAISLVRRTKEKIISYALQPAEREIMILAVTPSLSAEQIMNEAEFQHVLGMTIPNGSDLEPLVSFLLPHN